MVFIAGSFCFLTQFIRFYSLLLDDMISWILLSKKVLLANLTVFLYLAQSVLLIEMWYMVRSQLHSSIYYTLDLLVMLTNFENLFQKSLTMSVNFWVTHSSILQLVMLDISIEPSLYLSLLMNSFFFITVLNKAFFLI